MCLPLAAAAFTAALVALTLQPRGPAAPVAQRPLKVLSVTPRATPAPKPPDTPAPPPPPRAKAPPIAPPTFGITPDGRPCMDLDVGDPMRNVWAKRDVDWINPVGEAHRVACLLTRALDRERMTGADQGDASGSEWSIRECRRALAALSESGEEVRTWLVRRAFLTDDVDEARELALAASTTDLGPRLHREVELHLADPWVWNREPAAILLSRRGAAEDSAP